MLNAQCASGSCVNGYCHGTCKADTDCGAKDRCVSGLCTADHASHPGCRANGDCVAGEMCVNGACRSSCTSNADCCNCAGASVCHLGFCSTPGEAAPVCSIANDCGNGKSCLDALCI